MQFCYQVHKLGGRQICRNKLQWKEATVEICALGTQNIGQQILSSTEVDI